MTDAGPSVAADPAAMTGAFARPSVPIALWAAGALALAAGLVATGTLSADAISIFDRLPGCAEGAGCAEAANSKFGALPLTDDPGERIIPVSLLGSGFVFAMAAMWVHALVRGVSALVPWLAGSGAFVSTAYLGIVLANADEYICRWCIASHAANLVFFVVACLSQAWRLPRLGGAFGTVAASGVAFVVATGTLFGVYRTVDRAHAADQEAQQNAFVEGLLEEGEPGSSGDGGEDGSFAPIDPANLDSFQPIDPARVDPGRHDSPSGAGAGDEEHGPGARLDPCCAHPALVIEPAVWQVRGDAGAVWLPAQAPAGPAEPRTVEQILEAAEPVHETGFIGRYLTGPEQAHARIVMVSSYQCPACVRKYAEIERLLEQHPDRVNFSTIHYPLNSGCNPHVDEPNEGRNQVHPNGCWAARAAESAGILGGDRAFTRMSGWLYENNGQFRAASDLFPVIDELGFNRAEFFTVMQSEETLRRVREDAAFAKEQLGVFQTPTLYINGRELHAWSRPDAVFDTVGQLLAGLEGRPMRTSAADRPPNAVQKLVDDFLQHRLARVDYAPRLVVPNSNHRGPDDAGMVITITGGVTRESTWRMHEKLRAALALVPDDFPQIRWEYRHDPLHSDCDEQMRQNIQQARARAEREGRDPNEVSDLVPDGTCEIHFTLQALAELAGTGPFFDTLWWTLEQQGEVDNAALVAHILETYPRVQEVALREKAGGQGVLNQVATEGALGRDMRNGSPVLYLNGQYVPPTSWSADDPEVLRQILMHKAGMSNRI